MSAIKQYMFAPSLYVKFHKIAKFILKIINTCVGHSGSLISWTTGQIHRARINPTNMQSSRAYSFYIVSIIDTFQFIGLYVRTVSYIAW